jgi:para-aminobenzoate synthetase/4-amino-4-deoxychorismate lyase
MDPFILLENRKSSAHQQGSFYFDKPSKIILCHELAKLNHCLDELQSLKQSGYYLVGFISYEAAYAFHPFSLDAYHSPEGFPFLLFYAFKDCQCLNQDEVTALLNNLCKRQTAESFTYDVKLQCDEIDYKQQFQTIKNNLFNGETYQVNLTAKYKFKLQGCPIKLYQDLRERQKVEYGALMYLEDYQILSFSPELFFSKQGTRITTKPMKGTLARAMIPYLDEQKCRQLQTDEKLRAENLIIVDLLRNDLSRFIEPKSLQVEQLLTIETYETLHQMTSTISAKVDKDLSFKTILQHLFPCGSITGAPKRKTMQIIHDSEKAPRKIYTGSIGLISPNNDMCFNVAIRTLLIQGNQGELGVGGGITYDSNAEDEYEELQLKANFFTKMDRPFKLIESIKYAAPDGYFLVNEHLQRLKNSALMFNFSYDEKEVYQQLQALIPKLNETTAYKVRLILDTHGKIDLHAAPLGNNQRTKIVLFEKERIDGKSILLQHKTIDSSIRRFYQAAAADYPDDLDVLFINQEGFITESSIANVLVQSQGKILTPAISCGLLPGLMRQKLMKENPKIEEGLIRPQDLYRAEKIWLCNSVRGLYEVFLSQDKPIP